VLTVYKRRSVVISDGRGRKAFTLVELLVVVAIIALLLAMLAPMLNKAMQIARRVQCVTNMKVTGTAVHMFAGTHKGRAPSHAVKTGDSYMGFWGELAEAKLIGNKMTKNTYEKGTLDCPEVYKDLTYLYWMQTFEINAEVAADHPHPHTQNGQPYTDPVYGGQAGSHGLLIEPPPSGFIFYAVGRPIQDFPRASWKFMVWECQNSAGDEMYGPRYEYANQSPVPLYPPGQAYAPWTSNPYGTYCFRHMVPREASLYPGMVMANFLFIDAHVESLRPVDHVNYTDRFSYAN